MQEMNRDLARAISQDVLAALDAVAKKHNVAFSNKGGRFSSSCLTMKIEAAVIGASGTAETQERTAFKLQAKFFQLDPAWLDMTFAFGGEDYTIVGLNTKAYKSPVLATQASNGKTYKFKAEHVESMMRAQHPTQTSNPTTV